MPPEDQQARQRHHAVIDHHADGFTTRAAQPRRQCTNQRERHQRNANGTDHHKATRHQQGHVDQGQLRPLNIGPGHQTTSQQTPGLTEQQQATEQGRHQGQHRAEGQTERRLPRGCSIDAERRISGACFALELLEQRIVATAFEIR